MSALKPHRNVLSPTQSSAGSTPPQSQHYQSKSTHPQPSDSSSSTSSNSSEGDEEKKGMGWCVDRCFCLPTIIVDILSNNMRSKALVCLILMLLCSILTYYWVLRQFLDNPRPRVVKIDMLDEPQDEAYFGVPMPEFSVRLVNEWNLPMDDVDVTIRLFPNEVYTFTTQEEDILYRGRQVNCLNYLLLPSTSRFPADDARMCNPIGWTEEGRDPSMPLASGYKTTTDNRGVAIFSGLTLFFGMPQSYTLQLTHHASSDATGDGARSITKNILISSALTDVSVTDVTWSGENDPAWQQQGGRIPLQQQLPIAATVRFVFPKYTPKDDAALGNDSATIVINGLLASIKDTSQLAEIDDDAIIASVNCHIGAVFAMPWKDLLYDPENNALLENNVVRVSNAKMLSAGSSGERRVEATLNFPQLQFMVVSRPIQYPAVFLGGRVRFIYHANNIFDSNQLPKRVFYPFYMEPLIKTAVLTELTYKGTAHPINSSQMNLESLRITEGEAFSLTFRATDTAGAPVAGRRVFLRTNVGSPETTAVSKRVEGTISDTTDADGVAHFPSTSFSPTGATGVYLISVMAGVGEVYEQFVSVTVVSGLYVANPTGDEYKDHALYMPTQADGSPIEVVVGESWPNTPTVRLVKDGKLLSGQRGTIWASPTGNPGRVAISSESRLSGPDGFLGFTEVVIRAADVFDIYTFQVYVDGIAVGEAFKVRILPPTSVVPGEGSCAYTWLSSRDAITRVSWAPTGIWLGTAMSVLAVDIAGNAPANATVILELKEDSGYRFIKRGEEGTVAERRFTDPLPRNLSSNDPTFAEFLANDYALIPTPGGTIGFFVGPVTLHSHCGANFTSVDAAAAGGFDSADGWVSDPLSVMSASRLGHIEATPFVDVTPATSTRKVFTTKVQLSGHQLNLEAQIAMQFAAPIVLFFFAAQTPAFNTNYLYSQQGDDAIRFDGQMTPVTDLTKLRKVKVNGESTTYEYDVTLTAKHDTVGDFVLYLLADGMVTWEGLTVTIPSPVATIQLVRGLQSSEVSNATVGDAFPTQPALKVLDVRGNPLEAVTIVAQFAMQNIGNTTLPAESEYLRPLSNLEHGFIASLALVGDIGYYASLGFGNSFAFAPVSQPSTAAGDGSFTGLGLIGAVPDKQYRVRYVHDVSTDGSPSIAVVDPVPIVFPTENYNYGLGFLTNPRFVQPGVTFKATARAYKRAGVPFSKAVGKFLALNEAGQYVDIIRHPRPYHLNGATSGYFNQDVTLHDYTPPGEYKLQLNLPGGVEKNFPTIIVTDSAAKINWVEQPSDQAKVRQTIRAKVRVTIADGSPQAGALVIVTMTRSSGVLSGTPCKQKTCGRLDTPSARATTDADGVATLDLMVRSAEAGFYEFSFDVVSSTASVLQRMAGSLRARLPQSSESLLDSQSVRELASGTQEIAAATGVTDDVTSALSSSETVARDFAAAKIDADLGDGDADVTATATTSASATYSLFDSATAVGFKTTINISTEVKTVDIVTAPAPGTDQDFVIKAGRDDAYRFKTQPKVLVKDSFGRPMARRTVDVLWEEGSIKRTLTTETGRLTGADGTYTFTNLRFDKAGPTGTFSLIFMVDGVASAVSSFDVNPLGLSMDDQMLIIFGGYLLLMMPLFFSTMPYSHGGLLGAGCVVALAVFIAGVILVQPQLNEDATVYQVVKVHISTLIICASLLLLCIFVTIVRWFAQRYGRSAYAYVEGSADDQRRANEGYDYTQWLMKVRRKPLSRLEWNAIEHKLAAQTFVNKLRAKIAACCCCQGLADTIRGTQGHEIEMWKGDYKPPEIPMPDGMAFPTAIPVKVWIALTVSCVVNVTFMTLTFWVIELFRQGMTGVYLYLPAPPTGLTATQKELLNSEFQSAAALGLNSVAMAIPGLKSLTKFESRIRSLDFWWLWDVTYDLVKDLEFSILNSTIIGAVLGVVLFVVMWILMVLKMKPRMQEAQRGLYHEQRAKSSLLLSDKYIGMQVMHMILAYFLHFLIFFLLFFCILTPIVREFLRWLLWPWLAYTLIGTIVTMIFEKVFVGKFLVNQLVVLRLHGYLWYTLLGFFLSVLGGIIKSLVRFGMGLGAMLLLFPRLDIDNFPAPLNFMDAGRSAYWSMLLAHEEYNNAVYNTFAAMLIGDNALRMEAGKVWEAHGILQGDGPSNNNTTNNLQIESRTTANNQPSAISSTTTTKTISATSSSISSSSPATPATALTKHHHHGAGGAGGKQAWPSFLSASGSSGSSEAGRGPGRAGHIVHHLVTMPGMPRTIHDIEAICAERIQLPHLRNFAMVYLIDKLVIEPRLEKNSNNNNNKTGANLADLMAMGGHGSSSSGSDDDDDDDDVLSGTNNNELLKKQNRLRHFRRQQDKDTDDKKGNKSGGQPSSSDTYITSMRDHTVDPTALAHLLGLLSPHHYENNESSMIVSSSKRAVPVASFPQAVASFPQAVASFPQAPGSSTQSPRNRPPATDYESAVVAVPRDHRAVNDPYDFDADSLSMFIEQQRKRQLQRSRAMHRWRLAALLLRNPSLVTLRYRGPRPRDQQQGDNESDNDGASINNNDNDNSGNSPRGGGAGGVPKESAPLPPPPPPMPVQQTTRGAPVSVIPNFAQPPSPAPMSENSDLELFRPPPNHTQLGQRDTTPRGLHRLPNEF